MSVDLCNHAKFKQLYKATLHDAVKQCQVTFANKRELATSATPCVSSMLSAWETIFMHGLRRKTALHIKAVNQTIGSLLAPDPRSHSFWPLVKHYISVEERNYLTTQLRSLNTDIGLARGWLRLALNEHSLERHLLAILGHVSLLREFYEPEAFLLDMELSPMLTNFAAGVNSILFALEVDDDHLNSPIVTAASSLCSTPRSPLAMLVGSVSSVPSTFVFPVFGNTETSTGTLIAQELPATSSSSSNSPHHDHNKRDGHRSKILHGSDSSALNTVSLDEEEVDEMRRVAIPMTSSSALSFRAGVSSSLLNDGASYSRSVASEDPSGSTSSSFDLKGSAPLYGQSSVPLSHFVLAANKKNGHRVPMSEDDGGSVSSTQEAVVIMPAGNMEDAPPRKTDAFTVSELRTTLLETIDRKDALEQENRSLKEEFESMLSKTVLLQDELSALKANFELKHEAYLETTETLRKENEVLKLQLKKYLSTVQMLSAQQREMEAAAAVSQPASSSHDPVTAKQSNQSEVKCETDKEIPVTSQQLEEKLQQMSQMHGELLELNDHLTRRLLSTEARVVSLRQQLEAMCGPLSQLRPPWLLHHSPSSSGDDQSGKYSSSERSRCYNISLWIPTAFLRGSGTSAHHVYQIYMRIYPPDTLMNSNSIQSDTSPILCTSIVEEWITYRRYAEFRDFHKWAKTLVPSVGHLDFPPKQLLSRQHVTVVETRRHRLEIYLRHCLRLLLEDRWDRFQKKLAPSLDVASAQPHPNRHMAESEEELASLQLTRRELAKWIPFIAGDRSTTADANQDRFQDIGGIYMGI